ncbi:MAG: hypothetical protein EP343_03680 [Deltaproteobacteria bacterium]|nr:MAG: hypothetical protein EP343_03680 [Deltaproteobacteria bacterium]
MNTNDIAGWRKRIADDFFFHVHSEVGEDFGFRTDYSFGLEQSTSSEPATRLADVMARMFPVGSEPVPLIRLDFVSQTLDAPTLSEEECRIALATYTTSVRAVFRLLVWEQEDGAPEPSIRDIYEQEIWFGTLPLLTEKGTFLREGVECFYDPKGTGLSAGGSLVSFLTLGLGKVRQTAQKRLQAAFERCQGDYLDIMPHDLFSVGPLHTQVRRWLREHLVPVAVHNPVAQILQLQRALPADDPGKSLDVQALLVPQGEQGEVSPAMHEAAVLVSPEVPSLQTGQESNIVKHAFSQMVAPGSGSLVASSDACVIFEQQERVGGNDDIVWPVALPFTSLSGGLHPLFSQTSLVGQENSVVEGQLLAAGPGMKKGQLALGRNVTVAFVSMDEASSSLGEVVAYPSPRWMEEEAFTSTHLCTLPYERYADDDINIRQRLDIHARMSPGPRTVDDYDEAGVIRQGCCVESGDVLVSRAGREQSLLVPQGVTGQVVGVSWEAASHERSQRSPGWVFQQRRRGEIQTMLLDATHDAVGSYLKTLLVGKTLHANWVMPDGSLRFPKGTTLNLEQCLPLSVTEQFDLLLMTEEVFNDPSLESRLYRLQDELSLRLQWVVEKYSKPIRSQRRWKQSRVERGFVSIVHQQKLKHGDILFTRQGVAGTVENKGRMRSEVLFALENLQRSLGQPIDLLVIVPSLRQLPSSLEVESPSLQKTHSVFVDSLERSVDAKVGSLYVMKKDPTHLS